MSSTVADVYKLAYQVTPIWLTGDPMNGVPGHMLPFAALSDPDLYREAVSPLFETGALALLDAETVIRDLDNAFGAFTVIPGGTLVNQVAAEYPWANQHVAANATIFEPLTVSLIWDTPMRGEGAWGRKYATITNVQSRLTEHNNNGGTYTVVTPSYIYENLILKSMADASRGTTPIPQNAWRFDFEKPLVRIVDLLNAQSQIDGQAQQGVDD